MSFLSRKPIAPDTEWRWWHRRVMFVLGVGLFVAALETPEGLDWVAPMIAGSALAGFYAGRIQAEPR